MKLLTHNAHQNWKDFFDNQFNQEYFKNLINKININYQNNNLFPSSQDLFKIFNQITCSDVKVVMLGQDPYHNIGQANGIAFSVNKNINYPPSLTNIFKELKFEFNIQRENPDLLDWVNQGVLLINTIWTVIPHRPLSCKNWGWETFTINLLKYINNVNNNIVYLCLGQYAYDFIKQLNINNKYILRTSHPSPYSAHKGFIGSNIFKKTNKILLNNNQKTIKWC